MLGDEVGELGGFALDLFQATFQHFDVFGKDVIGVVLWNVSSEKTAPVSLNLDHDVQTTSFASGICISENDVEARHKLVVARALPVNGKLEFFITPLYWRRDGDEARACTDLLFDAVQHGDHGGLQVIPDGGIRGDVH